MASYEQSERSCPVCKEKRNAKLCEVCGSQTKNGGTWSVRFRIIDGGNLINKRLSGFERKKDAEKAYTEFITNFESTPAQAKPTLMDFATAGKAYLSYIENEREVKESTLLSVESLFVHIIKFFSKIKLDSVTDREIREFKESIKDYSYNYKSKMLDTLGSFFRYLDNYHDTTLMKHYNRVTKFKDTSTTRDINFWTYEEYQRFISIVDDESWALFFDTLYFSGCRKGELFGLRVNKVSFDGCLFIIDSQVTHKTKKGIYAETTPKSKNSIRDVLMPQSIISRIKKSLNNANSTGFVFGGDKPFAPETLRRTFANYIEAYNKKADSQGLPRLPKITPHDLRHSHVSFIINKTDGGDLTKLYAIADRIGDTVEQVLKTYGHLFKSSQVNLVKEIEKWA